MANSPAMHTKEIRAAVVRKKGGPFQVETLTLQEPRPDEVLTDEALSSAYGCRLRVNAVPDSGIWVLPHAAA